MSTADALCNLGEGVARRPIVLKALIDMLNSGSRRKFCHAAQVLGSMREATASTPQGVLETLVDVFLHTDMYMVHYAALGLGMIGEAASKLGVGEMLMGMLSHAGTGRARYGAKAIGDMRGAAVDTPGVMGEPVGTRPCRLG